MIAIFGDPVEHSRSPAMHNAAFDALGLDFVYVALRVPPPELARAVRGARSLGLAGWNVTVPHKERILRMLDRLTPAARAIGAVNTVTRIANRLVGDNTDGEGFRRALGKLGFRADGKAAVLIGAGGSARAVAHALARAGIAKLTILNRTRARATALGRKIRDGGRAELIVGSLESARRAEMLRDADLVVNCTSLGLDGKTAPPLLVEATPQHCLFFDLVYSRTPTPFVRLARRSGRRAEDGRSMLVEQAALAFRSWTGRAAPIAVMTRALHDEL